MSVSVDTEKSVPRVRVQLQLESKDGHPKELVRRCTVKGNEVVEVASFKFVRIAKSAEAPVQQGEERLRADGDAQGSAHAVGQPTPMPVAPCPEQVGLQQRAEAAVDPFDRSPSVKDQVLPDAAPSPSHSPLRVEQDAEDGEERRAGPRERDLNVEMPSLLSFIPTKCPTAVSVTWVLAEALRLAVDPSDTAGRTAAAAVLHSFQRGLDQQVAAARQLLQGGPDEIRQYDGVPPMVRELCVGEPLVANLRQQLAALEQEEEAWRTLEEKYRSSNDACVGGAGGACGEDSQGAATNARSTSSGAVGDNTVQQVDLQALSAAQWRADVQLKFQVQCIDSMLDKAERLVEKAQQACQLLQADYHKENFQSYVHVNSPQVLVKILSQAAPVAGVDCIPSSQPSQA